MGNISIVISVAPALGPTISGLILSFAPWRALFVLVLPIAVAALLFGLRRIENVNEASRQPADPLSVVLVGLGFGPLVYGLTGISSGGSSGGAADAASGGAPVAAVVCLVVGVLSLGLFVRRQLALQKQERPLLDLRTFSSRTFTVTVALMVVMMGAMFGVVVLLPIFLQKVLGLSTLSVGLMMLPGGLAMGLLAPLVGRAVRPGGAAAAAGAGPVRRGGRHRDHVPGAGAALADRAGPRDHVPGPGLRVHPADDHGDELPAPPAVRARLRDRPHRAAGRRGGRGRAAGLDHGARRGGHRRLRRQRARGHSEGTSAAFTLSTVLALVTVVIALFVRRSPEEVPAAQSPEPGASPERAGEEPTAS